VIDRESDRYTRWIKESIWLRRKGTKTLMNRDEGAYNLHNIYTQLLTPPTVNSNSNRLLPSMANHQQHKRAESSGVNSKCLKKPSC